jgi:hypothetical protein
VIDDLLVLVLENEPTKPAKTTRTIFNLTRQSARGINRIATSGAPVFHLRDARFDRQSRDAA